MLVNPAKSVGSAPERFSLIGSFTVVAQGRAFGLSIGVVPLCWEPPIAVFNRTLGFTVPLLGQVHLYFGVPTVGVPKDGTNK